MKQFFKITLLLFFLIIGLNPARSQSTYNKVGGVAFRIDDHQTAAKWRDFNRVFKKYGYHYSLGIDIQRVTFDTASVNALKEVEEDGNELMDHTPYGTTCYLWVYNLADTMGFVNHSGVDHINKNRICLTVDSVITTSVIGEGLVDLIGNKLISRSAGEFKNMYSPAYYSNIYLPSKNLLCAWYNLENKNALDPDTLALRSYWQETFVNDTAMGIAHHRLSGYDIKMTNAAQNLLIERSLYLYDSLGFPRPYTWVQPGGAFTQFTATEVKAKMGKDYGYTAAATYVAPSFKMYNEVDSLKIKRFALQNPDFTDESSNLQGLINTIADNSARHLQSFSLGHFVNLAGGWEGYLSRIDSLLAWCRDNEIPVRTVNEWASIMFDSIPNPFANAIPELYRDLNKNGIPDGMVAPFGTFENTDGVTRSKNRCISRSSSGNYFAVTIMGGVEKGWNRISAYTKGMAGDSIRITINFPELSGSAKYYNLGSNTSEWKEVSTLVYIDPKASRVTLQFNALKNNIPGTMKLSGMQLRKQSFIRVDPNFTIKTSTHKPFSALGSTGYTIDSAYTASEYRIRLLNQARHLTLNLDTLTNIITAIKPSIFWQGTDSIKVLASNPDKTSDSAYIHFQSSQPAICIGDSIFIQADASFGSNFNWIGKPAGNGFWAKPSLNTWYVLQYTNNASQLKKDSLQVLVNLVKPAINLVNEKIVCFGNNLTLTIPNAGNISWYNESGIKIKEGAGITFNNMQTARKLLVSNYINSCGIWDTIQINVNPIKRLNTKLVLDTTKVNQQRTIVIPNTSGLSAYLLNTPVNQFIFSGSNILFNPNLNFTGRDSARFHFTDDVCSHDTVWIKMLVKNTIGLSETDILKGIHIYPNPAKNQLNISRENEGLIHIRLFDLYGRILINEYKDKQQEQLDLSLIATGIYILKIETTTSRIQFLMVRE